MGNIWKVNLYCDRQNTYGVSQRIIYIMIEYI